MEIDSKENIPGMMFRLVKSMQRPPIGGSCLAIGQVILETEIVDLDTWKAALVKLKELRIALTEGLLEEMVEVSQKHAAELEDDYTRLLREKDAELEMLRQKVTFLEADVQLLRSQLWPNRGKLEP